MPHRQDPEQEAPIERVRLALHLRAELLAPVAQLGLERRVAAGVLSAGHARALLALEAGPEAQEELAARIVAEGLSVRATEEIVAVGEADGRERVRVARPRRPSAPGLTEIADRLSDRLDRRWVIAVVALLAEEGAVVRRDAGWTLDGEPTVQGTLP